MVGLYINVEVWRVSGHTELHGRGTISKEEGKKWGLFTPQCMGLYANLGDD